MFYDTTLSSKMIKKARIHAGYGLEQAANLLGISDRHLVNMENGHKGCSIDLFIRMSEVYNVSLDYLILGKPIDIQDVAGEINSTIDMLQQLRDCTYKV